MTTKDGNMVNMHLNDNTTAEAKFVVDFTNHSENRGTGLRNFNIAPGIYELLISDCKRVPKKNKPGWNLFLEFEVLTNCTEKSKTCRKWLPLPQGDLEDKGVRATMNALADIIASIHSADGTWENAQKLMETKGVKQIPYNINFIYPTDPEASRKRCYARIEHTNDIDQYGFQRSEIRAFMHKGMAESAGMGPSEAAPPAAVVKTESAASTPVSTSVVTSASTSGVDLDADF